MSDKVRYCWDCLYFKADGADGEGTCHRHAPRPQRELENAEGGLVGYWAQWPKISGEDFCGEFAERPVGQEEPTI